MPFSIDDFFSDASRTFSKHVDFWAVCAGNIIALREDPTSRIAEIDIYSRLAAANVSRDTLDGFQSKWMPQLKSFRELCDMSPPRTPALRLFKICAQSVAARYNHALDRTLAGAWQTFAVLPEDNTRFDTLIDGMKRFHFEEEWIEGLVSTWKFLFEAGGHGDKNIRPPSVYYEVSDRKKSHIEIMTPYNEDPYIYGIREYRKAELEAALSLLEKKRLVLVLGHPGWRPVMRDFDLWLETLKMKVSGKDVKIIDLKGQAVALPAIAKKMANKFLILAETEYEPHAQVAEGIARQLSDAGVMGTLSILAIDHQALNDRQIVQMFFGEKALQNGGSDKKIEFARKISSALPALPGEISDEIKSLPAFKDLNAMADKIEINCRDRRKIYHHKEIRPQAFAMPGGNWGPYLNRMSELSKTNVITIGQCATPFFTMNLGLMA